MEVSPIVTSVDPITFEILSHRLYQIAKEMGTALERVGGTVNTTQMHDYMAALYLANGDVLSAGDSMGLARRMRGICGQKDHRAIRKGWWD